MPGGSKVTQVRAFDPDESSRLRYSIDASRSTARNVLNAVVKQSEYNYTAAFIMNSNDGAIVLRGPLDREKVETIRLWIVCEDTAAETQEPQMASTPLTIIIEDTNDNDPVFIRKNYLGSIPENSQLGTQILTVVAEDKDKNRTISYEFQGFDPVMNFVDLDNETGVILVKKRIDRELTPWLNFTVRATDSGIPSKYNLAEVFIKVSVKTNKIHSFCLRFFLILNNIC